MKWKLELVVVPVADVDRAKAFYSDQLGFDVDHDSRFSDDLRIVQLTPRGSACSIAIGVGVTEMEPGSAEGLQLVVPDVRAARAELAERGVEVGEVQVVGPDGMRPSTDEEDLNNAGFVFFSDPDGNRWAVQEINTRP